MKVFVIGGITVPKDHPNFEAERGALALPMATLGRLIVRAGHDLLVCSPFPGSADVEVAKAAAGVPGEARGMIEFHYPDANIVREALAGLRQGWPPDTVRAYGHPIPDRTDGKPDWEHGWLLAQLSALDQSHGVVAVGGKPNAAARLVLLLAEGRGKPVLPFTFLGGAAAEAFERRRYLLTDRLQDKAALLHDPAGVDRAVALLDNLSHSSGGRPPSGPPTHFFVSYPRERPQEADFVEMLLRRRSYSVFRDDRDFGPGRPVATEVTEHIHKSDVFIAIWCREYACSPWCSDELELALDLQRAGSLKLWILCVDQTRIVPRGARGLLNYPAHTREELESHVLKLLEYPVGVSDGAQLAGHG